MSVPMTAAERRLRTVLRVLGAGLLVAGVVYALGPLTGPFKHAYRELPFVSNSAVKVTVLGICCIYASGDVRRRMGLTALVIAAHVVSVSAMLAALAFGDTSRTMDFGSLGTTAVRNVLWGAIGLDGAITLAVVVFFVLARRSRPAAARPEPRTPGSALIPAERRMRVLGFAMGALFVLAGVGYELGGLLDSTKDFFYQLPFVTNSVVKVGTFALLCLYVARDVRRELSLWGIVVVGHVISPMVGALYLIFLDTSYTVPFSGHDLKMTNVLWGAIGLDGALAAIVLFLPYVATWRARYKPKFFRPMQYRALLAAAEVVIAGRDGRDEAVPPEDIAASADRYLSKMTAHRTWLYRVALAGNQLHPLLFLKPPLSELSPELARDHMKTHFQKVSPTHSALRNLPQVAIRVAQQVCYAAYYNDPRAWKAIGYTPFSERKRYDPALRASKPHPLDVETPKDIRGDVLETEVCIVGSGAGGSILAYELASRGHNVLVLERGRYVEPRHFTEDEVEMVSDLYADGVMQQTEDFRFTVLQGSCVGGSTTVNNAVCFRPPERVLARWNDPSMHDAGLDLQRLSASVKEVEEFLYVTSQLEAPLNRSAPKYLEGVAALRLAPGLLHVDAVDANIRKCLGCGYCNIGCAFGRKLSMLDTALPWAQKRFPGRVRIVAECEVERIRAVSGEPARAVDLRARLSDGRRVTVQADKFVVAAGTVASSYLLMTSGLGRDLPVGKQVSFNMGAPLTAEFDEPLDAYDGLQISHYGLPPAALDGFAFETWFNPPVAQAENMPGWFEDHFENMRRYRHLMAVGVIAGTAGNASINRALTGGAGIDYVPEQRDLATLARGLRLLAEILFAGGARRVMLNTWDVTGAVFTCASELERLPDVVMRPAWMALGTGHPQGGNALSRDPGRGVIGPDFRVHGYENLYVCDASVFPSSLTVNPQLTVMSLARYAAPLISGRAEAPPTERQPAAAPA